MNRKKVKRFIIPATIFVLLAGLCALTYAIMNSRTFVFFGTVVSHAQTGEKALYLTFDDGPGDRTTEILKTLQEADAKATFFLIGKEIEAHPEYARRILEEGHAVGNHSYTHSPLIFKQLSDIQNEVEKTNMLIRGAGYGGEIFFRPPNCKKLFLLPWYLSQKKQRMATWNIEPESDREAAKSAEAMAAYAAARFEPGAIILLHPMNDKTDRTNTAIRLIVQAGKEKGYTFRALSGEVK